MRMTFNNKEDLEKTIKMSNGEYDAIERTYQSKLKSIIDYKSKCQELIDELLELEGAYKADLMEMYTNKNDFNNQAADILKRECDNWEEPQRIEVPVIYGSSKSRKAAHIKRLIQVFEEVSRRFRNSFKA